MSPNFRKIVLLGACCAPLLLSGCLVSSSKNKDGKNDNVSIATPFGSMHVKTDDSADKIGIGLTVYPGAVPAKNDKGKDDDTNAADVNLSFGDFHLGVKAASYQTSDSPAKVEAFYRKDMAKYGDIIKCKGDTTIGTPVRTSQGLTCKDSKDNHITADNEDNNKKGLHIHGSSDDSNPELRAGSPQHQHIVSIEPKNGGTKIGLVMLDLPHGHDSDKSE